MVSDSPTFSKLAVAAKNQKQFVQLHFAAKIDALLPTEQLAEIVTVLPDQIMPMPHMSPWLMGVHNWRAEILWLVDLGQLVGFTPLYRRVLATSNYTVAVLQLPIFNSASDESHSQTIGLVVDGVGNIQRCDADLLQSSSCSATDTKLEKLLRGYWLKSEREILAVLDPNAIWREIAPTSR